ncbi:hypothetical protein N7457_005505 [Penicillium paradoxum]|uniref:uncharacterized protein n=1 Tax=Penicillium paradoxum TaxID=176176 RepID=UPI0025499F2F|nr:uncharacterized protein N7457_005505 [Penicillium paradoxum]KAJ5780345.1 hypothetical protein N7457_005505 [Penicillium paradoxum]
MSTTVQHAIQAPDVLQFTPETPLVYTIEVFSQTELLKQPFLSELQEVINESYRDPGGAAFEKTSPRLKSETQLANELQETGFTAIAFDGNAIIGSASLKIWAPYSEGPVWKLPGHFDQFRSEEIISPSTALLESISDEAQSTVCEGTFELAAVGIKPNPRYRRKGIAEILVRECEQEAKRRTGLPQLRITLKVVRDVAGDYWLKKGFRVIGEQYCPPLTWDYKTGFVLWAMEREISTFQQSYIQAVPICK